MQLHDGLETYLILYHLTSLLALLLNCMPAHNHGQLSFSYVPIQTFFKKVLSICPDYDYGSSTTIVATRRAILLLEVSLENNPSPYARSIHS